MATRTERKRWQRVEIWVNTKDDQFLARMIVGDPWVYEVDEGRAVKALERFLKTRWPLGYSISYRRTP